MVILAANIPQNIEALKEYILTFNAKEQVTSTENPDSLEYMSMNLSDLYSYVEGIQLKLQPLRYKYNRLLSSLSTLEFDDNCSLDIKKSIFLKLRDEIMAVLKGINELNKMMAPIQNLINSIIEEDQTLLKKFPQTLNAIALPQSTLMMPKAQQLKTPNYEITTQPLTVNTKMNTGVSSIKKGSNASPSTANISTSYSTINTAGSSGKRRSTKSTPQSISPYVNLHSAGTQQQQQHSLLQQQLMGSSNHTTPSYINTNASNINPNTMLSNSNLGLKSLSPEDILKQNNPGINNNSSTKNTLGANPNSVGSSLNTNSLNLNFDFDNFDDFLK